jgi:hypothetical protein
MPGARMRVRPWMSAEPERADYAAKMRFKLDAKALRIKYIFAATLLKYINKGKPYF